MSTILSLPNLPDRILTDRVNTVPPGGTITINGKKPVAINLENKTINPIFCHLKVSQEPILNEPLNVQPNESISFIVDRTTTVANFTIQITNQSLFDVSSTVIEACIKK